jgi:hypothetical protein
VIDPSRRARWLAPRRIVLAGAVLLLAAVAAGIGLFYLAEFGSASQVNWLGVVKRQLAPAPTVLAYCIQFCVFLIPGACLLTVVSAKRSIAPHHILPAVITGSAIAGYASFWAYFLMPLTGKIFSATTEFGCFFYLLKTWRARGRALLLRRDVTIPGALMFFAGLFYVGFVWLFDMGLTSDIQAQSRFIHMMPPDNVLPGLFAERLYHGVDPRPLFSDWLSSDRPPLQAGLALLQRPYRIEMWDRNYQLLGTIYQCIWIPMIWSLCVATGFSRRHVKWILAACFLNGFFLLNSVYVWPKLLSAGMVVWAFTLLIEPLLSGEKPSLRRAMLAAVAAALGFLSHGGVAFTLIALGVFFLIPRFFIGWKQALLGTLVFALMMVPWTLYQKYYEPPANRLLKWYLAGAFDVDSRTTYEAVRDAYAGKSAATVLEEKLDNALMMFPDMRSDMSIPNWRLNEFSRVLAALSAVNSGWFALAFYWMRPQRRPIERAERAAPLFVCVALLSLMVWWLLLDGSKGLTIIHQGSYAAMILLFVGLSGCAIQQLPRWAIGAALGVQILDFVVIWLVSTPRDLDLSSRARRLNLVMALTAAAGLAGLAWALRMPEKERKSAPQNSV